LLNKFIVILINMFDISGKLHIKNKL